MSPTSVDGAASPVPRTDLIELAAALTQLHRALLDQQRIEYERDHGPLPGAQLLQLAAYDDSFAWLRALSLVIVDLDGLLVAPEPVTEDEAGSLRQELEALFSAGRPSPFWDRCLPMLQAPPVTVGFGRVRVALARLPRPGAADVAAELHAKHRWAVARRQRGLP